MSTNVHHRQGDGKEYQRLAGRPPETVRNRGHSWTSVDIPPASGGHRVDMQWTSDGLWMDIRRATPSPVCGRLGKMMRNDEK